MNSNQETMPSVAGHPQSHGVAVSGVVQTASSSTAAVPAAGAPAPATVNAANTEAKPTVTAGLTPLTTPTEPPAPLAVPSLRGTLVVNPAGDHVCQGKWALSDALHQIEGQTSEFEFKLTRPMPGQALDAFPQSGRYSGWFKLKGTKGGKSKFDDMVELRFTMNAQTGGIDVNGEGKNHFGAFKIHGTFDGTSRLLQMYRQYQAKTPRPKTPKSTRPDIGPVGVAAAAHPSRERKANPAFAEFVEPSKMQMKRGGAAGGVPRQQRLNPSLIRCSNILADLFKLPTSVYFREPVDPIKFNLPDYLDIIKQPMDLGTMRHNLHNFKYDTPAAFAEHMRLVFRNAIEYNQARDNPVHMAARDLAKKFEEKFAALNAALNTDLNAPALPKKAAPRRKSSGNANRGRARASTGGIAAADPQLLQRIAALEAELMHRRQEDGRREAEEEMAREMQAIENPLTLEEKKDLVTKVHRLPSARIAQVIGIIRESVGDAVNGAEIAIDDLDTLTLRRLQEFVASGGGVIGGGSAGGGYGTGPKKDKRKSTASAKPAVAKKARYVPPPAAPAAAAAAAAASTPASTGPPQGFVQATPLPAAPPSAPAAGGATDEDDLLDDVDDLLGDDDGGEGR